MLTSDAFAFLLKIVLSFRWTPFQEGQRVEKQTSQKCLHYTRSLKKLPSKSSPLEPGIGITQHCYAVDRLKVVVLLDNFALLSFLLFVMSLMWSYLLLSFHVHGPVSGALGGLCS